jgi:hypothetical protein
MIKTLVKSYSEFSLWEKLKVIKEPKKFLKNIKKCSCDKKYLQRIKINSTKKKFF